MRRIGWIFVVAVGLGLGIGGNTVKAIGSRTGGFSLHPWPHFYTGTILPPPQEQRWEKGRWALIRKEADESEEESSESIFLIVPFGAPRPIQIGAAEIQRWFREHGFPAPTVVEGGRWPESARVVFLLDFGKGEMGRRELKAVQVRPVSHSEGYALVCRRVAGQIRVTIFGADPVGAYFGTKTLAQMLEVEGDRLWLHPGVIRDWPVFRLRSFKGFGQNWVKLRAAGCWAPNAKFNCLNICYTTIGKDRWPNPSEEYKTFVQDMTRFMRVRGLDCMPFVNPYYLWKAHIVVSDPEQMEALVRTCSLGPAAGGRRVMLCLDDFASKPVHQGGRLYRVMSEKDRARFGDDLALVNAYMIRTLYDRLRQRFPQVRLYVVPPYYWTPRGDYKTGGEAYLRKVSAGVPRDVRFVWTGPVVRSRRITKEDVEHYQKLLLGRKVMLWDNTIYAHHNPPHYLFDLFNTQYPDRFWELMSGEVHYNAEASEIYRVGLLCAGSYLWNPRRYEPEKVLQEALAAVAGARAVKAALRFRDAFYVLWDQWQKRLGKPESLLKGTAKVSLSEQDRQRLKTDLQKLDAAWAAFRSVCQNPTLVYECEAEVQRFAGYRRIARLP